MVAPAIRVFENDPTIGLAGVRFPVELKTRGVVVDDPSTWPQIVGRLEYFLGRLLYMPPCADTQQDVAVDVAFVLRSWSERHPEFLVGGNEAGMKLGGDIRAADVAVWRRIEVGAHTGRFRAVPPVLAVEVAGEDEEETVLREKATWYLERGVALVWLVLPETREVVVMTLGAESRHGRGDSIPEDARLPGLRPEVDRFFTQLDG